MKVLVIGSGAREHVLAWKCVQSDLVERVYCAPGNGGTGGMARNIPIGAADVGRIVDFAKRERLGPIVLGPQGAGRGRGGGGPGPWGVHRLRPPPRAGRYGTGQSFPERL